MPGASHVTLPSAHTRVASACDRRVSGLIDAGRMNKHHRFRTARTVRLLAGPAVVAAALGAPAPVAAAADEPSITCGSVITTDVRLSADLVDCAG